MKTTLFIIFALCFTLIQAQQTHEITWLMGISHEDASVTIDVGDTVKWIWGEEGMPHSVISDDPDAPEDFGSDILTGMGSVYEYTFTEAATFDYNCGVHPAMMGTITVLPVASIEESFIKNVSYYPNPVKESLTITSLTPIQSYSIFSIDGKLLQEVNTNTETTLNLNLIDIKGGIYFVKLSSVDNQTAVFEVIKQ